MDDICEACGAETESLSWDDEYECYVCNECLESPPEY